MAGRVTRKRIGGRTRPLVERPRETGFTKGKQALFLGHLAKTANVMASCRAAGISDPTVYKLRKRSADFRAAWAAALDEGYEHLELMLLRRAIGGSGEVPDGDAGDDGQPMTNGDAMRLLKLHRDTVEKRRALIAPAADSPAAVRDRIEAKLIAMFERLNAGQADEGAEAGD